MEKVNQTLQLHIAKDGDTTDKLLGAVFIIVNRGGIYVPSGIITSARHNSKLKENRTDIQRLGRPN